MFCYSVPLKASGVIFFRGLKGLHFAAAKAFPTVIYQSPFLVNQLIYFPIMGEYAEQFIHIEL